MKKHANVIWIRMLKTVYLRANDSLVNRSSWIILRHLYRNAKWNIYGRKTFVKYNKWNNYFLLFLLQNIVKSYRIYLQEWNPRCCLFVLNVKLKTLNSVYYAFSIRCTKRNTLHVLTFNFDLDVKYVCNKYTELSIHIQINP